MIKGSGICGKGEFKEYYVVCPVCNHSDKQFPFYCDLCGKFICFGENITCFTLHGKFRDSINHVHTNCIKKQEMRVID
jgi:hypothetical protein